MVTHFFLLPDRTSARRARRMVAEAGGALGLVVGSWPELMDNVLKAYLLPDPSSAWSDKLGRAAAATRDAFWSASLEVAPVETEAALAHALQFLLEGAGPAGRLTLPPSGALSDRAMRRLSDLERLHEAMDFALPPALAAIAHAVAAPASRALHSISVYYSPGTVRLNSWQQALIDKLNADSVGTDPALAVLFSTVATSAPVGGEGTSLARLQTSLFGAETPAAAPDDTLQWLAVRDFLEEIEVAVGMAQQALADDPTLCTAEIGFLVPGQQLYCDALTSVCASAGLPLSALPSEKKARDLGREAVLLFLQTRPFPAPAMALAALLASPLMPWSEEEGISLAQEVMDGNLDLDPPDSLSRNGARMLRLIRQRPKSTRALSRSLSAFARLLQAAGEWELHRSRAIAAVQRVKGMLPAEGEVPWCDIVRCADPEPVTVPASPPLAREGMAVFTETEEPWRAVRHLFVLGFSEGRYPCETSPSPIFSDLDLAHLKERGGYDIETPEERSGRRRMLFLRQIGSASEHINFLVPRRDCFGKEIRPSETLTYMAKMFAAANPEDLVLELEREADRARARGIAVAPQAVPLPVRALKKRDLFLKRDLLCLHRSADGSPRPQSPSSLETLMVSPLAWLLSRSRLEPREWAPESLDVASKGTLAHDVFEHLFLPDRPLPTQDEIKSNVPALLDQAIVRRKPFLMGAEWHVERRHLQRDIEVAALSWRGLLEQMEAKVLGNEVWLRGKLDTLPIHGSADLLIELPQGRLYVVDYKKASSGSRRERMKKGYDSQASLYRLMIETGGAMEMNESLKQAVSGAKEVGVAYFMMNDQTALADSTGWVEKNLAGVEEMGGGISDNAMNLIRQRLAELREGKVQLNHEEDPDWFRKNAAMTIYALENSPLISLFMKSVDQEGGAR